MHVCECVASMCYHATRSRHRCLLAYLDKAVAPVVSKGRIPKARGGHARFWGRRHVDPFVKHIEKGEQICNGLACMYIEVRMGHEGIVYPTWLQPLDAAS